MVSHRFEPATSGDAPAGLRAPQEQGEHWKRIESDPRLAQPIMPPSQARRSPLRKLRAVVLLGGAVRATALRNAIGRSVVDLPIERGRTLLGRWREQCIELAETLGIRGLPVRLILDRATPGPSQGWVADPRVMLAVERDPVEYRGTGGVLCDLARGYERDDYLLIGNAAQLLRSTLPVLAAELATGAADVSVISHTDGTPSGLMLARCASFAELPSVGFVDLKEQALPAIARHHRVEVVEQHRPSGLPVRTLGDYIEGLRRHHDDLAGVSEGSHLDDWKAAFSLAEEGATVHPSARIHNSVILSGGRVEEGAVVVGSLVCPGGLVRRGKMAVDQLVTPARR